MRNEDTRETSLAIVTQWFRVNDPNDDMARASVSSPPALLLLYKTTQLICKTNQDKILLAVVAYRGICQRDSYVVYRRVTHRGTRTFVSV